MSALCAEDNDAKHLLSGSMLKVLPGSLTCQSLLMQSCIAAEPLNILA